MNNSTSVFNEILFGIKFRNIYMFSKLPNYHFFFNNLVTDDIIWYTFDNILCTTNLPKSICQRTIELEIEDFTKPSEMNSIMN